MATIIKNINDLKNHVDVACGRAVESACNRLLGHLQRIIDENSPFMNLSKMIEALQRNASIRNPDGYS